MLLEGPTIGYQSTPGGHHDPLPYMPLSLHMASPSTASLSNPTSAAVPAGTRGTVPPRCCHGRKGTFGRPGEYRRHMKKHNGPRYLCNEAGCNKGFYRRDKLRDHLRQKHKL